MTDRPMTVLLGRSGLRLACNARCVPQSFADIEVLIRVGVGAPAREGAPMLKVVHDAEGSNEPAGGSLLQ